MNQTDIDQVRDVWGADIQALLLNSRTAETVSATLDRISKLLLEFPGDNPDDVIWDAGWSEILPCVFTRSELQAAVKMLRYIEFRRTVV